MLLRKILAGDGTRKTRLHDEQGNLISSNRLIRNGSRALAGQLARHMFNYRPLRPWISYDAAVHLEKLLQPKSRVLEFGSGMSTGWYANRAAEVVSIEDYKPWFEQVTRILSTNGLKNVVYRLASSKEQYLSIPEQEAGSGFDLIMVDGKYRDECVEASLHLLRPGGILYFDNSDRGYDPNTGDTEKAVEAIKSYADKTKANIITFTDFAPAQFVVQQGLLMQIPAG